MCLGEVLCLAGGRNPSGPHGIDVMSRESKCCSIHVFVSLCGAGGGGGCCLTPHMPSFLVGHFQNKLDGPSPCPNISRLTVSTLGLTSHGCSVPRNRWLNVWFRFLVKIGGASSSLLVPHPLGATSSLPHPWCLEHGLALSR